MTNQERLQANNAAIENIQQTLASKMIVPAADYATIEDVENAVKDKATITYVDTKVADLVNSAPETLDTLGEVATALQNNSNVVDALNSAIGNKVDKVSGKGLSTNDYTTAEKEKLSGLSNYDDTEIKSQINSKASIDDMTAYIEAHKDELKGDAGANGKSAYEYAKDGGYTGTEQEFAEKMGVDILEEVTYNTTTNNLFDGELEYGWINEEDGTNVDIYNPITASCRSKNYIEVEGGKNLTFNVLNGQSAKIVQYNANKEFISFTTLERQVNKYDTGKYKTLDANTRYVRFAIWGEVDFTTFKLNLYYVEHTNEMWSGAGDVFKEVPHFLTEDMGNYIISEKIPSTLTAKKIVYDGDSICMGLSGGGGYPKLIADKVNGKFVNAGIGGGRLRTATGSTDSFHSIVDNLENLPQDGDLYCFEGGINDYWTKGVLGTYDYTNFDGELDETTVCGALETIFRYALNIFVGKPICFIITHKIQGTAYSKNSNGNSFEEYHDAMVGICKKYSIPYYDAFAESGLNGWNTVQNNRYLTGNSAGNPDGCHPNEDGYKKYYVPQLIALFEKIMPKD